MKKNMIHIFLIFLLSHQVLAKDANTINVEELSKTSLSWDGGMLPEYPKGTPEVTMETY